ncbi:hypothetical protein CUC53_00505 [Aeromonas cavernicola]|uniref:Uncharacterized protein n=2 Tax=Aeromonas cavernicola TaxID=1006623 RepID=A0A2H9U9J4_9GAMM|nr:hypothetical protein CUC53_00505 [Aeromonas cavernicola]
MKKLLLVMGILLGIGGSSLYIWMKPQTDDPYFFLSPKSLRRSEPILIPIALHEKGASVDYVFWLTPLPQEKLLYLFPTSEPLTGISLEMKNSNYEGNKISFHNIFGNDSNPKIKDKTPIFNIELYKINNDLSESIIKKEIKRFDSSDAYINSFLFHLEKKQGYGQYRFKMTVLWDRPEINHDDLKFFIEISPRFYK